MASIKEKVALLKFYNSNYVNSEIKDQLDLLFSSNRSLNVSNFFICYILLTLTMISNRNVFLAYGHRIF